MFQENNYYFQRLISFFFLFAYNHMFAYNNIKSSIPTNNLDTTI